MEDGFRCLVCLTCVLNSQPLPQTVCCDCVELHEGLGVSGMVSHIVMTNARGLVSNFLN